jgi:hypothetical protein
VRAAVADGTLSEERLESHARLARELRYSELRREHAASWVEKRRWKAITGKTK